MDWSVLIKAFATLLAVLGFVAVVLGFPGTFIAWLGVAVYAAASRFVFISEWLLLGTFIGCAFVELADNFMSGMMVKKFGASKGSMLAAWLGGLSGALLGGLLGGIGGFFGSALFSVVGAFFGSYFAVYYWERYRINRSHKQASQAAFGTILGRLLGIAVKLGWIFWLISLIW